MTGLAVLENVDWKPRGTPKASVGANHYVRRGHGGTEDVWVTQSFRSEPIVVALGRSLLGLNFMRTEVDQLAELRRLADAWEQETLFESSTQQIIFNPNYQRIIGFGERALSFIFDELRSKGGYWFWALKMITGEDPVSPRDVGNYEAMRAAWLNWAAENGM